MCFEMVEKCVFCEAFSTGHVGLAFIFIHAKSVPQNMGKFLHLFQKCVDLSLSLGCGKTVDNTALDPQRCSDRNFALAVRAFDPTRPLPPYDTLAPRYSWYNYY
jgi:hypothetical protein